MNLLLFQQKEEYSYCTSILGLHYYSCVVIVTSKIVGHYLWEIKAQKDELTSHRLFSRLAAQPGIEPYVHRIHCQVFSSGLQQDLVLNKT